MFHKLEEPFEKFCAFRCKMCHQILFSSQEVVVYIKSDLKKFGSLEHVSNYKASLESVSYLMFDEDAQFSSIEMVENQQAYQSVLFQEHPFLMMYMNKLRCSQCQAQLGYHVQTVNENTAFMLNRSIIDIKALQTFHNQVNNILEIVSNLDQILVQQIQLQQIQQAKSRKIYQKQQKILAQYRKSLLLHKQKEKQKEKEKQRQTGTRISLNNNFLFPTNHNHNTRPFSFISKFQTRPLASTNIQTDYLTSYPLQRQKQKQRQKQRQKQCQQNQQQKNPQKQKQQGEKQNGPQNIYRSSQGQQQNLMNPSLLQTQKNSQIRQLFLTEHEIELIFDSIINQEKLLLKWIAHQEYIREPIKQILNSFKFFYEVIRKTNLKSQQQKKQFAKLNHLIQNEVTQKLRKN